MSWGSCQKSLVFKHELNKLPGNTTGTCSKYRALRQFTFIPSKTGQQIKTWKLKKCFNKHSYYCTSASTITKNYCLPKKNKEQVESRSTGLEPSLAKVKLPVSLTPTISVLIHKLQEKVTQNTIY